MESTRSENLKHCNCSYKKGKCCLCIAYYRDRIELPACYFTKDGEASYDRTIENYLNN